MNILSFDLGASGGKLFLASVTEEGCSLREVHRFENVPHEMGDSLYWDIYRIYEEMNTGIRKAIEETGDRIDSFAIDSFSNDFALIGQNGQLLSPVHCYRDPRTVRCKEAIYGRMSGEKLYSLSGNQLALFNTYMQLGAICEEGNRFLLDQARRLLFIPDFLIYLLTGEEISEYTISSVSQMFDFSAGGWSDEILSSYQIPRSLFGRLTQPGTVVGATSPEYNRKMGTRGFKVIAVCEHDTASAFLSSPLLPDCALISCGTWCLIGTETPGCVITPEGFAANLANEGGFEGHHRLLRNVMGTWLLQESRRYYRQRGQEYSFGDIEKLALSAEPFTCFFDPDADCFFQPGNVPEKIRALCASAGLPVSETPAAVFRCIYESLAMKFRWVIGKLEEVSGKPLPVINIVGGGVKASLLCQFAANACGRTVIAGPSEATAIGNLEVQLLGLGGAATIEEAREKMKDLYHTTTYTPQDTDRWDAQYRLFAARFSKDAQ